MAHMVDSDRATGSLEGQKLLHAKAGQATDALNDPFQMLAGGVILQMLGYLIAHLHHHWWLEDRNWTGTSDMSSADRIAGWIDTLGLVLIAAGLLDGLAKWILHWG